MRTRGLAGLIAGLFVVAGCSAHGTGSQLLPSTPGGFSSLAAAPQHGRGDGGVAFELDLPTAQGADFTRAFPGYVPLRGPAKYQLLGPNTGKQILVEGILYESYATNKTPRNGIVVPLNSKGGIHATMSFSNVEPANNQWALFDIYLIGADGSTVFLGSEAGVIDIKKPKATKIKVDAGTTQLYQAFIALIRAGLVDAHDLQTNAALLKSIAGDLKKQHLKPEKATGLYSDTTLAQFVTNETNRWQRTVKIEAGSTAREISVANDVNGAPEANLNNNLHKTLGSGVDNTTRPPGAPCGQAVPPHIPGVNPPPLPQVCATIYGTVSGTITVPVYGASVLIGASNGQAPFQSAQQTIGERGPGSKTTVKLNRFAKNEIDVKVNDPFDWAFGTVPGVTVSLSTLPGTQPFAVTNNYFPAFGYDHNHPAQFEVPANFSKAHPTIAVNGWNPFGLNKNGLTFCTTWNVCQALLSGNTFQIVPPLADPGTSATFFKWQGLNGTVIKEIKNCQGYSITPNKGTAVIQSTVPTVLVASQFVQLLFGNGGACGSFLPRGSAATIEGIDTNGTTWTGFNTQDPPLRGLNLTMDTYQALTTIKRTTITFKVPVTFKGAINLITIASSYTP